MGPRFLKRERRMQERVEMIQCQKDFSHCSGFTYNRRPLSKDESSLHNLEEKKKCLYYITQHPVALLHLGGHTTPAYLRQDRWGARRGGSGHAE
jgi:hypothetical protein